MALPVGKLTILVGAGILGSVLAKEGRVSDLFSGAFRVVFKQIQRDGSKPSSSGKPQNDSLMDQVNSLRQELQLLASSKAVTIISTGRSGTSTYGVPVVVVMVVGYGYIWWKGWKLSDLMFVTRRGFSDACSSVGKQFDQVSSSISGVKRHLSSRIDRVDCNIDECAQLTSATKDEVSELRGDLKLFCTDVDSIHRAVQTLETKIGRIKGKQDITTNGVHMLCEFVETIEKSSNAASIQASLAGSSRPALEHQQVSPTSRTVSLPLNVQMLEPPSPSFSTESPKVLRQTQSTISASGLKELQELSNFTKASTSSESLNGTSSAEGSKTNGSSSGSGWFGRKLTGLNASFLSRTNSATMSFK